MPRTESPNKRSIRFCGDCGYELARDNDGTCPMCRRFEQLRIDFTVPRPSDLTAQRVGDASHLGDVDEWPPTVAEYRAVLAERRSESVLSGEHAATVIRTPGMRQSQVPPPPIGATAAGDDVDSSAILEPPARDVAPPTVKKAKATAKAKAKAKPAGGQAKSRRAARARGPSWREPQSTTPPATPKSPAPVEPNDVPAAPSARAPKAVRPSSVAGAPTRSEPIALATQGARPLLQAKPVRDRSPRSRVVVPLPSPVAVAVLVLSALTGAAVALLLSMM